MQTDLGNVELTSRGFEIVRFKDATGTQCILQQSSLADNDIPGTSAIWIGVSIDRSVRMHLDRDRVEALIIMLNNWIKSGHFRNER